MPVCTWGSVGAARPRVAVVTRGCSARGIEHPPRVPLAPGALGRGGEHAGDRERGRGWGRMAAERESPCSRGVEGKVFLQNLVPGWPHLQQGTKFLPLPAAKGSVSAGCPLFCSLSVAIPFPEHIICLLGGMRDGMERGSGGFFGTWGCPFGT